MNLKPTFKHESSHKVILERYSVRLVPPYENCNVYGLIKDGKPFRIEMAKIHRDVPGIGIQRPANCAENDIFGPKRAEKGS